MHSLAGVDGVLIVDLPPEEANGFQEILKADCIDMIYLLAPTTKKTRAHQIIKLASGYLYYVSLTGVTGSSIRSISQLKQQVQAMQSISPYPVCVGFGISTPDQAKAVACFADGVIVGSALVDLIHHAPASKRHGNVMQYVGSLKQAIQNS